MIYDDHQVLKLFWCGNCCAHLILFLVQLVAVIVTQRKHIETTHHQGIWQYIRGTAQDIRPNDHSHVLHHMSVNIR
jgi:hypothetical protein